eukprot:gnl/MRDRNA2_/MRDRNA2_94187_c0_seq1.p1 gnl/MRDRNA2_/MRDRNA2_94187_c0~~gnl/MRDRNA2_/MRDRNA2_94187_c0_seq1.p1  ORF type:complete len:178 (-),score=42.87 gnl/MRDRNA2_/MRDRNA2_94187_c0_seq1:2-457(-)
MAIMARIGIYMLAALVQTAYAGDDSDDSSGTPWILVVGLAAVLFIVVKNERVAQAFAPAGKQAEFSKMKVGHAGGLTDEAIDAFNDVAAMPVWDALEPIWAKAGKVYNQVPMPPILKGTTVQATSQMKALLGDDSDDEDDVLLLEDGDCGL